MSDPSTDGFGAWLRARGPVERGTAAFALYLVSSVLIFAGSTILHLGSRCVGTCRQDSKFYVWALAWMPHALRHGLDPLWTNALWAPRGVSLAWTASIPGPASVTTPITVLFGPLTSLNVLLLAAPAFAGWAAYLMCNQVTRRFWPSFVGGCVLAFSAYIGQYMRAQINIVSIFLVPLAVYLVLRRVRGTMGPVAFVGLFAALLVGQLSIGTETFATMTLFGTVAFVGVCLVGPPDLRDLVRRTGALVALAYLVAGIVAIPFLVAVLSNVPSHPLRPGDLNSADLLSYLAPPATARFGGAPFAGVTATFAGIPGEAAYVGVVLIGVIAAFAFEFRHRRSTWLLLAFIAIVVVLSFGPVLHVGGRPTIWLPGSLLAKVPLLGEALPSRFPLYVWLALSIIVSIWIAAAAGRGTWLRSLVVVTGIAFVSLNLSAASGAFHGSMPVPAFFADGTYRRSLTPGEIVLTVPNRTADDLLWQVDAGLGFRLPRAYVGPANPTGSGGNLPDRPFAMTNVEVPTKGELVAFLREHAVRSVIVEMPVPDGWNRLLEGTLGSSPTVVRGVAVWDVPTDLGRVQR